MHYYLKRNQTKHVSIESTDKGLTLRGNINVNLSHNSELSLYGKHHNGLCIMHSQRPTNALLLKT